MPQGHRKPVPELPTNPFGPADAEYARAENAKKRHKYRDAVRKLAQIGPINQETACAFIEKKIREDKCGTSTLAAFASVLANLDRIPGGKPYATIDHTDAAAYMTGRAKTLCIEQQKIEGGRIKQFLLWVRRQKDPDLETLPYRLRQAFTVRVPARQRQRTKQEERPITRHEFDALLAVAKDCKMAQALYWLLWDGALRIGEALALRVKDLEKLHERAIRIWIPLEDTMTKTGEGDVTVHESVPALQQWRDKHPLGGPDDYLFVGLYHPHNRWSYTAARRLLHRHLDAAGLRKSIHFHLFRKTSATRRARAWRDPEPLKAFHRWSPNSKEVTKYILGASDDARELAARDAGITPEGQPVPTIDVGSRTCPFCAETIKAAAIKCRYCHEGLGRTPSRRPHKS